MEIINQIPAAMQAYLQTILAKTTNEELKKLLRNTFVNTWTTTMQITEEDAFVITGDIPAMWLRDSSAQVKNYLPLMKNSDEIRLVIGKVIARQMASIVKDPYANAFNREANGHGHVTDQTEMSPWVWERKYEVDSLCYAVRLAYQYYTITGDKAIFTPTFKQAMRLILQTFTTEQRHENSPYRFTRTNCPYCDTLHNEGKGNPVAYTGMTWSGFRPSDDACTYGYLIPSNMFAVVALKEMAHLLADGFGDQALADQALALSDEINGGILTHGVIETEEFGKVYAYEVDGMGNVLFMDDANVPSLISAPYLGYCQKEDEIYQNTRNMLLSKANPYYFEGEKAKGIGSPHTPNNYVWHIALAMQGLTATSPAEQKLLLDLLLTTHADCYYMHEGVNVDNPHEFTRPWFAWANTICSEFLITCIENGIA
ncbi:MAG: glycoside hydrolase family 125 protein [Clostridia bacterium]|nr:glycoside hydrolase family 125 protein [Clostridia bacterium]